VEGVALPAGAVVDVCIGSANRDERRWERSEQFRYLPETHATPILCRGEHTCMGLHLARMETRVALESLLTRLTDISSSQTTTPYLGPAVPFSDCHPGDVRRGELTDGTTAQTAEGGSISVDEILNGAFEVAAEVSIDNLGMRCWQDIWMSE